MTRDITGVLKLKGKKKNSVHKMCKVCCFLSNDLEGVGNQWKCEADDAR